MYMDYTVHKPVDRTPVYSTFFNIGQYSEKMTSDVNPVKMCVKRSNFTRFKLIIFFGDLTTILADHYH